ncbi:YeiH family protein [Desulfobotulus mexicanus]|uniref:Putative sulfate exporter family transporter n=1 Tax=Desulfobotulus mexicanus TaxID=2586642 RepID=A0A5Q4VFB0_9BACT|nr:putative sulfate exporter family transporter [Desulfobotulus mexicanus]TYT75653.1 putative sulfate exporter family transporter [Desulfobotulus mexicanus]
MSGQSRQPEIVVDQAKWEWSELYKKEDWWAIWLGIIILIVGLIIFLPRPPADMDQKIAQAQRTMQAEDARAPFHTLEWHRANDSFSGLRARNESHGKTIAKWLATPARWASNPMEALILTEARAAEIREGAKEKHAAAQEKTKAALAQAEADQAAAANAAFQNTELNKKAEGSISQWRSARSAESRARSQTGTQAYNKIPYLFGIGVIFMLFFAAGTTVMNINTANFIKGFGFVFLLAIISEIIGANSTLRSWGFGPLIWAILGGMLIANTIGTPQFIKDAAQTEYFIKTGLVLLGAEILFGKILAIGLPGIFVAWVVTPTVLVLTYIFGQKVLKMESKTLNITVSSDMCVCGVSAAIATAAACRATKEELTIAIGMSMLFTAIMMIALPTFIVSVGMHPVLGGAWIGGTIDSTGAVVAAGAFLGETGMFVAATIKMIQNIMIGAIAFGVAVYWCAKVDCVEGQTVKKMEIWYRFPKFVLGFIAASVVFSIMIEAMGARGDVMLDQGVLRGFSRPCREWFFILAFASIGLTSNFREMAKHFTGGKPVILYVCGQSLNLALTLLMAYIMFFLVFPDITASL